MGRNRWETRLVEQDGCFKNMHEYAADDLARITAGTWSACAALPQVSGFCFDARQIKAGECFVALSGGVRDGHAFIAQAVAGGASSALVERVVDVDIPQLLVSDSLLALGAIAAAKRKQFRQPVIGITGSCGKTSTKEMLRLLLGAEQTHATAGNWNNRIGVPMTLFGLDSKVHSFAVVEAGINQPGEMQHLGEMIEADLTLFTNVGPAHLELLGSLEAVADEKARLAQAAVAGALLVMPRELLEFAAFRKMADRAIVLLPEGQEAPNVPVRRWVRYRLSADAGAGGAGVCYQLTLTDSEESQTFTIATPSRGIATNAALALVAARELGMSAADLQSRIAAWRPAANRGGVVADGSRTFYVDCYNANPASMRDALNAFVATVAESEPRAFVLGAMNELGRRAVEQHEQIGQELRLRQQDRAYFIGPKEWAQAYYRGALEAGAKAEQLICAESIENLKSDIAAFKGALFLKGSRSYQLEKLLPETR